MSIFKHPAIIYDFPRDIALKHGVKEAIVFRYLARKVRVSKDMEEGIYWYANTPEGLAEKFPGISSAKMACMLEKLEEAHLIRIENFDRSILRATKERWYHVPEESQAKAGEHLIRYDFEAAKKTRSIAAGVVLVNLRDSLKCQIKESEPPFEQRMAPDKLAAMFPFPPLVIVSALNCLTKARLVIRKCEIKHIYTLPPTDPELGASFTDRKIPYKATFR